jgi:cbb3-type cytochrome oxidase maturation protein
MFPSSLTVILTGLLLGAVALSVFVWGWRTGQFRNLDRQMASLLDERDLRVERPWESLPQRAERRHHYGEPLDPEPGEWGGST